MPKTTSKKEGYTHNFTVDLREPNEYSEELKKFFKMLDKYPLHHRSPKK